jgi:hypothetical protein
MLEEGHIKYIINKYPQSAGNNTLICYYFYKEVCERRGIELDERFKQVMIDYKPESIVRKRRDIFAPTREQTEEELKFWKEYKNH